MVATGLAKTSNDYRLAPKAAGMLLQRSCRENLWISGGQDDFE